MGSSARSRLMLNNRQLICVCLPKTLEPIGVELRIAHCVRDVFGTEVLSDRYLFMDRS